MLTVRDLARDLELELLAGEDAAEARPLPRPANELAGGRRRAPAAPGRRAPFGPAGRGGAAAAGALSALGGGAAPPPGGRGEPLAMRTFRRDLDRAVVDALAAE